MTFTDLTRRHGNICWSAGLAFITTLVIVRNAHADIPNPPQVLSGIINQFSQAASGWETAIQQAAVWLFWTLAGIEIAWTGVKLALEGADLKQFAGELVRRIMFIGFFFAVLKNSESWASAIVKSLMQIGVNAGGASAVSPDNVLSAGITLTTNIMSTMQMSIKAIPGDLTIAIGGIIIIVVFGLLAAMLVLALVEMYIALSAGIILLGFGGCSWTNDFAKKYLTYCVSVGMKLMVIELIIGIGMQIVQGWTTSFTQFQQSNTQMVCCIGASIVMLALTKSIPEILQGLVTGVSIGANTGILTASAAVAGAGAAMSASVAGGGMAVTEAAKSGWQQSAGGAAGTMGVTSGGGGGGGGGSPGKSGFPGMAGTFARVASAAYLGTGALGRAAATDVGGRITGANRGFGTMGGRMAADMRKERLGDTNQSTGEGGGRAKTGVSGNISPGGDET